MQDQRTRQQIITTRGYAPAIAGDKLSLKIASYPSTAQYLAKRLNGKGDVACELCCGIGVSLLELAKSFKKVIGVDNNQAIIDDCETNLKNAGVKNYELFCGDVSSREILSKIKADVVLYDIPYWSNHGGQVNPDQQNPNLKQLISDIQELITPNIVIYTPTHMTYQDFKQELGECEYLKVFTNGKHDRNFVFMGEVAGGIGEKTENIEV